MLAYIGSVSLPANNSGTPGVTTQDFTVGGGITATPKAARITVCASEGPTNDQPHIRWCQGYADGTFQGGITFYCETGLTTSNSDRVPYDDAIIRLLNPSGSYDAVGAFDSFIPGGIRILWNTIPTGGYVIKVELWFGTNVSVKAGFATPPANGSGPTQVATGFAVDHVMTLSCAALSSLNETLAASGDIQMAHTVRTTGTTTITRNLAVQFRDAVSGGNSTSNLYQGVALTYRGGSMPFLVLSGETQITGTHATDGFMHDTAGTAGQVGPSYIYLAVGYGGNAVELVTSVTGTTDGANSTYGTIPAWSALTFQTIRTGTGWNSGNVSTPASCFGDGSASMHSDVPQTTLTGTNEDGVGTTNAFSWSDEGLFAMPESGSPVVFYKGEFQQFPGGGGVEVQWNPAPADAAARQVVVFLLGRDIIQGNGAGNFPLATGAGTGSLTFQGSGAGSFPLATGAATGSLTFQATGAGSFPLAQGAGTGSLTFQATGAGSFPLAQASGLGSLVFQATGAGSFPLALADGLGSLTFQAAGAGSFPLATADGLAVLVFQGTGSGSFPLALGDAAALLVFQGSGAGAFPLATGEGTGEVTNNEFQGVGAGVFPLAVGDGLALLVFQATGAGVFPLPTAQGFGPPADNLACEVEMEGDYDPSSVLTGDFRAASALTGERRVTTTLLANYQVASTLRGDYETTTDLEGDNC